MRLVACIAFKVRTQSGSISGGHAPTDSASSGNDNLPPVDTTQLLADSDSDDEEFRPTHTSGVGQLLEEESESESESEEEREGQREKESEKATDPEP